VAALFVDNLRRFLDGSRSATSSTGRAATDRRRGRSTAVNVLSIQSSVVYGRVGNRAAVPVLERLGHDVWPVDTVAFSNHPAHGSFRGRIVPAAEVRDLVEAFAARGVLARCDAVLSGYLGDPPPAPWWRTRSRACAPPIPARSTAAIRSSARWGAGRTSAPGFR
jgi:hypothetical protein